eukprot:3720154-Pyramimonas_sp.AAC.1
MQGAPGRHRGALSERGRERGKQGRGKEWVEPPGRSWNVVARAGVVVWGMYRWTQRALSATL